MASFLKIGERKDKKLYMVSNQGQDKRYEVH